ncbi:MAG TPA: trans-aconitate 2-methyltransferase [Streptosporangiaceae bacterium]|nr:trans-aconitate 2-methyltransferase [Streptosporangiaceae bacterium]
MSRDMGRSGTWDPEQYGRFGDERSRPFFELLDRVRAADPVYVVDLGCGSGELTATLADRWPAARIEGIDSSPEMIAMAERRAVPGLQFTMGDIATWTPAQQVDVIVSNAALQWVPAHRELLPKWINALSPGGWLAFQVPGNFDGPSHTAVRELCGSPRWRDLLGDLPLGAGGGADGKPVDMPEAYLELLATHGCRPVDAWETTYSQVLQGTDPVLEWIKGTALRPVLSAFDAEPADPAGKADFLTELAARLRAAYPARPYGTVFPFRRVFVVARRDPAA